MIKAFPWKNRDSAPSAQGQGLPPADPAAGDTVGRVYGAQLNRVEATLNNLLTAVAAAAEPQPRPAPTLPRETLRRPSLGAAIAEVSRRQQELEDLRFSQPRDAFVMPSGQRSEAARPRATSLVTLQNDIAGLATRLDAMQREQAARYAMPPVCNLDKLRAEIATMSEALRDVASRGSVATVEAAIRGLSQKIEDSRSDGMKDVILRPMEELVAELRQSLAEIDPRMTIKGLEGELRKLGIKIEDLGRSGVDPAAFGHIQAQTREIRDLLSAAIAHPMPIERIERQVAELAESLGQQQRAAPSYEGFAAVAPRADTSQFAAIEARLEEIAAKVEESLTATRDQGRYRDLYDRIDNVHEGLSARIADVQRHAAPDTSALENLVLSLSEKIERAIAPQADHRAIEALEEQIGALARRMDQSNTAVSLSTLERTISELFGEFERTRVASLETAEQTARNAVREAFASAPDHAEQDRIAEELSDLRSKQAQADQRALSTLNAVHETLEKVVERLSTFEAELAERRNGPGERPAPVFAPPRNPPAPPQNPPPSPPPFVEPRGRNAPPEAPPSAPEDFLIEPGTGFPGRRDNGNSNNSGGSAPPTQLDSLEAPASRSDFIAAARRAAQAAQRETAAAAVQAQLRPAAPMRAAEAKGGFANLIAHYRRPVVLSLAAIFVAVGAYALLKSLGHQQVKISDLEPPPAVVASMASPPAPVPAMTSAAKIDDSALSPNSIVTPTPMPPKAAAPPAGTDPIVTGSIAPRPAVQAPKPREMSFADLRNQARAGDAWAQFALATEYSDARFMSRDLNTAAQWYEKAAAQGLAPAQYRLASFYEKGLGVARDIAKAQALYQKAAAAGNVRAMHNLAVLAADGGDSGRPDYATAARWFKRAAEFGVRDSQYNYAVLLARGMGVSQDFISSYVWFAVAARQGDQDSAAKRDDVGARLSADQLATAKAMVEGFRPRTPSASANEVTMPVITTNTGTTPAPTLSFGQRPKVSML